MEMVIGEEEAGTLLNETQIIYADLLRTGA